MSLADFIRTSAGLPTKAEQKAKERKLKEDAAESVKDTYPNIGKEINLKPMYDSLYLALNSFHKLMLSIIKSNNSQTNESLAYVVRFSDHANEIEVVKEHLNKAKTCVIGDSMVDGIRCPSAQTMHYLDLTLTNIDKYMELDNDNVKFMFQEIKEGTLDFRDIKEFEIFWKNVYLELCSCVLAYYNSVIIAIGNIADFEHSNQYLIDYFNKKNIKNGTSNYSLIPATKNVFGELIHEKATGETSTKNFITRKDFNIEIAKRQAKNKVLQNG